MSIWKTLGIEACQDEKIIKRAYARLIKTIDQNTEARRFQEVRDAYDAALRYARNATEPPANDIPGNLLSPRKPDQPYSRSDDESSPNDNISQNLTSPEQQGRDHQRDDSLVQPDQFDEYMGASNNRQPAEQEVDKVPADVQHLAELVQGNEHQAVAYLKSLLTSPYYESLVNRSNLELHVLYMLYQLGYIPIHFGPAAQNLFEWNNNENHFSNNEQHSQMYAFIVQEITRARNIKLVMDSYSNHKPSIYEEVEKIVFGPFDKQKLDKLADDPDCSIPLKRIFNFIDSYSFHPAVFPVPHETYRWWREYLSEFNPPPPPAQTQRKNRTGRFSWLFAALILLAMLRGIGATFSDHDTSTSSINGNLQYTDLDKILHPEKYGSKTWNHPATNTHPRKTGNGLAQYYESAAKRGDVQAEYMLARLYLNGKTVKKDTAKALELLNKCARQNHLPCMKQLGLYYGRKKAGHKELKQAVYWYRKAANRGDAFAQNNLGVLYRTGRGTKKNYPAAFKMFKKSAEQGQATAQYNLATCYLAGLGVKKNTASYLYWIKKSAKQNMAAAQFALGLSYEKGYGVEVNPTQAIYWYRKAASHDFEKARINLARLSRRMRQK